MKQMKPCTSFAQVSYIIGLNVVLATIKSSTSSLILK